MSTRQERSSATELVPVLDAISAGMIADPAFSLSEFIRQPVPLGDATLAPGMGPPLDPLNSLRFWLIRLFKEIYRITRAMPAPVEAAVEK